MVDLIWLDVYNQAWPLPADPSALWQTMLDRPAGLVWHRDFAAAHGKPRSFPEWGTGTRPDGHGAGDDPLFIANMAQWIASHNVVYHDYWDCHAPDFDAALSDGKQPNSERAFLAAFSPLQK